jgi:hypothetical protein
MHPANAATDALNRLTDRLNLTINTMEPVPDAEVLRFSTKTRQINTVLAPMYLNLGALTDDIWDEEHRSITN